MMSDLLIGLLHGPQGGSAKVIDDYYEQYEQFEDEFPQESRVKRIFTTTLELIRNLFPDIADVPRGVIVPTTIACLWLSAIYVRHTLFLRNGEAASRTVTEIRRRGRSTP